MDRIMKTILCCLLLSALLVGCAKTKEIQFCEGILPEGKGVNCGTKFEDGELTVLITSNEPFGVKTIALQVYVVNDKKTEKVESITVDVKPDKETATANLSFYTGGRYIVRAMSRDTLIGEGRIEIAE